MKVAVILSLWVLIGVTTGLVEARRGHWAKAWVVGACFGPFSVPLAIAARRLEVSGVPTRLRNGRVGGGDLDVLVGVDGSDASSSAATTAAALFGPRIRRMTLAAVLDFDTASPHARSELSPLEWDEERAAREALTAAARRVSATAGLYPGTMLLTGRPADALESQAVADGYDVLVTGCRGRGLAKVVLGSCASQLARSTRVPVVIVPEGPGAVRSPQRAASEPALPEGA